MCRQKVEHLAGPLGGMHVPGACRDQGRGGAAHLIFRSRYLKNSPPIEVRCRLTIPSQSLLGAALAQGRGREATGGGAGHGDKARGRRAGTFGGPREQARRRGLRRREHHHRQHGLGCEPTKAPALLTTWASRATVSRAGVCWAGGVLPAAPPELVDELLVQRELPVHRGQPPAQLAQRQLHLLVCLARGALLYSAAARARARADST